MQRQAGERGFPQFFSADAISSCPAAPIPSAENSFSQTAKSRRKIRRLFYPCETRNAKRLFERLFPGIFSKILLCRFHYFGMQEQTICPFRHGLGAIEHPLEADGHAGNRRHRLVVPGRTVECRHGVQRHRRHDPADVCHIRGAEGRFGMAV